MIVCNTCHKEIKSSEYIKVIDVVHKQDIWIHVFCSWKCLAKYIIESKRVKIIALD